MGPPREVHSIEYATGFITSLPRKTAGFSVGRVFFFFSTINHHDDHYVLRQYTFLRDEPMEDILIMTKGRTTVITARRRDVLPTRIFKSRRRRQNPRAVVLRPDHITYYTRWIMVLNSKTFAARLLLLFFFAHLRLCPEIWISTVKLSGS